MISFVWSLGLVVAIFVCAFLAVLVFWGHVFLRIRVLVVDVLPSLCGLGVIFRTSCIRVPGLVFLLCVLACACLLRTSSSCLPMYRVLAVPYRAFVGHVGTFLGVLVVFFTMAILASVPCGCSPVISRAFVILAFLLVHCWFCAVSCVNFIFCCCHSSCHVFMVFMIRGVFRLWIVQFIRVCARACWGFSF